MTPVTIVLDRLELVRETAPGRWMARCPAHDDGRRSLSVREGDDGRGLLWCFAGCGAEAVVVALGLEMVDLFPERISNRDRGEWASRKRPAPPIPAVDALRLLDVEVQVIYATAERLRDCGLLPDDECEGLDLAMKRVGAIADAWRLAP